MFWHLSVCLSTGGIPGPGRGGTQSQVQVGGSQVQVQVGGYLVSGLGGGNRSQVWRGVPSLRSRGEGIPVKGKIFDTRFGLIHVQTGKKFLSRTPPVKGKIFDTRFGLIHVQTGEKNFCRGTLPPPTVKGKIFDTRFGLIHVQTGEKFFCPGTPPVKGKIFDTRFGLIHVQTGKKKCCRGTFPPPTTIARTCYGYAAGGMPLAFTQEDFLVLSCIPMDTHIRIRSRIGIGSISLNTP